MITSISYYSGTEVASSLMVAAGPAGTAPGPQWRQLRLRIVSNALLTGGHDPAALAQAYPSPQVVLRAAQYMKDNRLSIFAGKRYTRFDQR